MAIASLLPIFRPHQHGDEGCDFIGEDIAKRVAVTDAYPCDALAAMTRA